MVNFRKRILDSERLLLVGFEYAVSLAMLETYSRCKGKPQEPDFLAMLMLEGIPYFNNCLQRALSPIGLKTTVSSVFCHQKPEVKFISGTERCELGDILIVHRHIDSSGRIRNNALLLQAKIASTVVHRISKSEQHQLKLYQEWPEFEYIRSGKLLNGQIRNVLPKLSHLGAQYLLINDTGSSAWPSHIRLPRTNHMAVWPAEDPLIAHYNLSEIMFNFLLGISGRSFKENPKDDSCGWSQVIWDLLNHSASSVFTRKNSGNFKKPRLGGNLMSSTNKDANFYISDFDPSIQSSDDAANALKKKLKNLSGFSDNPPNDRDDYDDNDPEGGISLLLIETVDIKQ